VADLFREAVRTKPGGTTVRRRRRPAAAEPMSASGLGSVPHTGREYCRTRRDASSAGKRTGPGSGRGSSWRERSPREGHPSLHLNGYKNVAHGGIVSALLDETMGWAPTVFGKMHPMYVTVSSR